MKNLLLFLVLSTLSTTAFALENPFKKLPFGIHIGVTKNEEIENRGVCEEEIKVDEHYYRCAKYDMAGGFSVFSSQNEIVNKVYFYQSDRLPRSWTRAGLDWTLNADQLVSILKKMDDVSYLEKKVTRRFESGVVHQHEVSFEVNNHLFEMTVDEVFSWDEEAEKKIFSIAITELY